jgi:hypothetical protein
MESMHALEDSRKTNQQIAKNMDDEGKQNNTSVN